MLFSSITFIFFFVPVFFTFYFLLKPKWKNSFALLGSILFYAWGAPKFVFVLSVAVICDFYLARYIASLEGKKRKRWLLVAIGINLSILAYFKYTNFLVETVTNLFGLESSSFVQVLLPIGISFFTFHEISYLTDVYRKTKAPFDNLINYALYIFLFPQLLVGPIIRFHEIADQIENRNFYETSENRLLGFFRFAIGLAKKVLLADVLAIQVDKMFSLTHGIPDITHAWLGAFLNVLHIYIDFSAYSDMALGLALMMGFRFPENFNSPLIAESVTEFWLRWHMSLNRWLREYIYIPLGGNRGTELQTCLNILAVFFISGIWHGANWNFIVWGVCCGLVIVSERIFLQKLLKNAPRVIRIVVAQGLIVMLLVLFKCHSVKEGFQYLVYMFSSTSHTSILFFSVKTKLTIAVSIFIAMGSIHPRLESLANNLYTPFKSIRHYGLILAFSIVLVALSASYISIVGQHPFLYFKF